MKKSDRVREPIKKPRKVTLYKGKRVDGSGYNLGRCFTHNGEYFISPPSNKPISEANRGYHYCDQVISESVCRDTGVYDLNGVVVCVFDIIKNIDTGKEYFVYKVGWHNIIYGKELTDEIKNIPEVVDKLTVESIMENTIKLAIKNSTDYIVVGQLYDYLYAYRHIKECLSVNTYFSKDNLHRYLAPGNIVQLRNNSVYIIQPSKNGLRFMNKYFTYCGFPLEESYSTTLRYSKSEKDENLDIMKVYICENHDDCNEIWRRFFYSSPIRDWNTGEVLEEFIKWDWSRL